MGDQRCPVSTGRDLISCDGDESRTTQNDRNYQSTSTFTTRGQSATLNCAVLPISIICHVTGSDADKNMGYVVESRGVRTGQVFDDVTTRRNRVGGSEPSSPDDDPLPLHNQTHRAPAAVNRSRRRWSTVAVIRRGRPAPASGSSCRAPVKDSRRG